MRKILSIFLCVIGWLVFVVSVQAATINFTSDTGSGFLESDWDQVELFMEGYDTTDFGDLITLSGVSAGAVNFGSFTGSIISDSLTLKAILQELETAVAGKQDTDAFLDDIAALTDPGADRIAFWDDSAGDIVWLTLGTNLSITGTTINAEGGSLADDSLLEVKLDSTNAATDNYILSYDDASGGFTWVAPGSGSGDLLADGTVPLTANWDAGPYTFTGTRFISDIAIGTSPFAVTSTTVCTNLNADLLDGESASAFEDADAAIVKSDENETITGDWTFSGTTTFPADGVNDLAIDWGTGANQVSAVDLPIADSGSIITATDVEAALQENRTAIDLNTAKDTNVTHTGEVTGSEALTIANDIIEEVNLECTNSPTDNYVLSVDTASGGFTWVEMTGGAETNSLETVCTGIASTEIPIGTSADTVTFAALSGDVTMTNAGVVTIANDAVDAAMISTIYAYDTIPIAWMKDGTSAPADLDDASTRSPFAYRDFDSTADEDLNFVWFVPSDLSGSTIQFRVKYLITNATGPSSEGVAFGLSGISAGDNDATNGTKGTVVVVTDTGTAAQHDVLITAWSGDVTVTNLAAGEVAEMAFIRDVSDAVDDYGQDVGVFAIEIRYVQNPAR